MINKLKSKKAFTIIEVVLVLGIAGLILLAVFIAVPALQRNKRNQIRRDDMARIMNAIVNYQGSHSGKVPIYYDSTANPTSECGSVEASKNSKSCFKLNTIFVPKYLDSDIVFTEDPGNNPKQNGGWSYTFTCSDDSGCNDFRDPDGTIYIIKTEGRGFTGGGEAISTDFNHVVHLAAYSRCASAGVSKTDTSGKAINITNKTDDANDVSLTFSLEGNRSVFCIDNQ